MFYGLLAPPTPFLERVEYTMATKLGKVQKQYAKEVIHDFIYNARFDSHTNDLYYKYEDKALFLEDKLIAYKFNGALRIFKDSVYTDIIIAYNNMYQDEAYPFRRRYRKS